jgi:hypothetical protein
MTGMIREEECLLKSDVFQSILFHRRFGRTYFILAYTVSGACFAEEISCIGVFVTNGSSKLDLFSWLRTVIVIAISRLAVD